MKYKLLILFTLLFTGNALLAQMKMEPKIFIEKGDSLPYLLKIPETQRKTSYPLIIWLHGSGERGNDNNKQYCNGLEVLENFLEKSEFNSFLCAPQCPANSKWAYYDLKENTHTYIEKAPPVQNQLMSLIHKLIDQYPVDPKRIYLIGLSMGGFGVWDLLSRYPGTFAVGIPICGGGDPQKLTTFCNTPIWAFHGGKDDIVNVSNTINVMKAIKEADCNKNSQITISPKDNHGVWYTAINTPGLLNWLFNQKL